MKPENNLASFYKAFLRAGILLPMGLFLHFVMHWGLVKTLGAEQYGVVNYVYVLSTLLAVFLGLGVPESVLRLVPQYVAYKKWVFVNGVLAWSGRTLLYVSLLFACCAMLIWEITGRQLRYEVLFCLIVAPLMVMTLWRRNLSLGFKQTLIALLPREVLFPVLVIFVISICYFVFGFALHSIQVIGLLVIAILLAELVGIILLKSRIPSIVQQADVNNYSRSWLSISFPFLATSISQIGLNRFDLLVLGIFVGLEGTGQYAVAARVAALSIIPLRVINTVSASYFSAGFYANELNKIRNIFIQGTVISIIFGGFVVTVLYIWGDWFLGLFGNDFRHGSIILRILLIGQMFNVITGPAGSFLAMTGREKLQALYALLLSAICLIANFLIIPSYGSIGAAYVTAITMALYNLLLFVSAIYFCFKSNVATDLQNE